jgi:hypothetical protein
VGGDEIDADLDCCADNAGDAPIDEGAWPNEACEWRSPSSGWHSSSSKIRNRRRSDLKSDMA